MSEKTHHDNYDRLRRECYLAIDTMVRAAALIKSQRELLTRAQAEAVANGVELKELNTWADQLDASANALDAAIERAGTP